MVAVRYLTILHELVGRLCETQAEAVGEAAEIAAKSIASGRLVHLFGTGHGSIPALEAFPRTGSYVGWHPVVVDALGPYLRIGGSGSVHQFRFLQGATGYGKAILDSFPIRDGDAFVLSSHSGVNRVVLEVAYGVKELGLPLIAITSLEHSRRAAVRHEGGRKLFEIADVVIDTGAPFGDAVIELPGLEQRVAAVSTSLAVAAVNALIAETADRLVAQGYMPMVLGHIDRRGRRIPDEMRRDYVEAFQKRLWGR